MDVELAAAVVDGHIAASTSILAIREKLVHELRKSEAALLENTGLTVLREDDIRGV